MRRETKVLALPAVIAAVVVGVYHSSFAQIVSMWMLSTYGHGWFIVPFAGFMLWQRRELLARTDIEPSWLGVGMLVGLAVLWHISRATSVQGVEQAATIASIPAAILAVMGWRYFKAAAFPLMLLLAAIPIGEALIPYLMHSTADIATALLTVSGIPFDRRGMMVSLPGGDFEVADICSGLKYLLASLTLGIVLAYYIFHSVRARVIFVAATAAVFIIGNGVRAFVVMIVASATEMRYFAGRDHVIFGMFFFVFLLGLMCWIGWRFADPESEQKPAPSTGKPNDLNIGRLALVGCAAVIAMLVGPAAAAYHRAAAAAVPQSPPIPAPATCTGPQAWSGAWSPSIDSADSQARSSYRCGDIDGHVLIATYVTQHQGKELVNSSSPLLPIEWVRENERTETQVPVKDGSLSVKELAVSDSGRTIVALYWYSVNDTAVDSAFSVKVQEALAALRLRPAVSQAYVVVAIGPADEPSLAHAKAVALAQAAWAARGEE